MKSKNEILKSAKLNNKSGKGAVNNIKSEGADVNIKNMKSNFKKCCKNYFIKDDNLYYKKVVNLKKRWKWEFKKIDILVPKVDELNKLLCKFYIESCHSNYKELKNLFYQNNIGLIGMGQLLEEYVRNCFVYCQTSRDFIRKDPIKSIEVEGPDSRYSFDITYLNEDMTKAFGIKYLLSILDCFSRKATVLIQKMQIYY